MWCEVGSFVLLVLLVIFIFLNCYLKENFTAPGLTLTIPPSWFPQMAAKAYDKNQWKIKMYLDRYPFLRRKDPHGALEYISDAESDDLASAYRFWAI